MPKKKLNIPLLEVIGVSMLLHVIGLFIFGGLVIWSEFQQLEPELEAPTTVAPMPPEQVVRIKPTNTTQATTKARIAVKQVDFSLQDMEMPIIETDGKVAFGNFGNDGLGFGDLAGGNIPDFQTLFGRDRAMAGDLEGTLYDLKQDRRGNPTSVDAERDYPRITDEFERRGWSENVLSKYYATDKKLYSSAFVIPMVSADAAPEAYGVQNQVQPSRWIAHYKGEFIAPSSGSYRFWGYADDLMLVRVKNRTVLDGSRYDARYSDWKSRAEEHKKYALGNGKLGVGDWFNLRKGEAVPMEVLIGERPGGMFGAFLLIEKRGTKYNMDGDRPILPIFSTSPLSPQHMMELRERLGADARYIEFGVSFGDLASN